MSIGKTHGCRDRGDVYGPVPLLPFPISRRVHVGRGRSFPPPIQLTTTQEGARIKRNVPIAVKLGADGASAGAPEVVADDPVALVLEHALVERLDVASVSG